MRKISLFLLFAFYSFFAFAAENKMQMVSYFPVPYVAYNDVAVTQFCDVGLLNQCSMNVGPGDAAVNTYVLDVGVNPHISGANVLNTGTVKVEAGRLNLNSTGPVSRVYSSRADVGINAGLNDTNARGEISFSHAANIDNTPAARSVSASNSTLLKNLQVYPTRINTDFPSCPAGVKWTKLPLNGNSDSVVLVCGEGSAVSVCSSSTKPAVSEACPTGCGTRTRRVWCNNGVWVPEAWSICGTKPASSVPCTSASYQCGASATRTVSCGNNGQWNTSAWNFAACFNQFGGGQSQGCASGCGTQTSTASCGGAVWNTSGCYSPSSPSSCSCSSYGCGSASKISSCSGGSCNYSGCYYPSSPSSCSCSSYGGCGSASKSSSCSGGSCNYSGCYGPSGGGVKNTASCGSGYNGTQYYRCDASCSGSTGCYWDRSGCTAQVCTPNSTQSQKCGNCGTQRRSCNSSGTAWGSYGTCTGQGACVSGTTSSQKCGNCGTQSRTCNSSCQWGSFGTCTGQGVCAPGATGSQACPSGQTGSQKRTCNSSCQWGSWSTSGCSAPQPKYSVTTSSFDGAMSGANACVGSGSSIRFVGSGSCGSTEAYSVCMQVGNGGSCKSSSYCNSASGNCQSGCSCSCRGTTYTCRITY